MGKPYSLTHGVASEFDFGMLFMEEGSSSKLLLRGKYNELFPQISPEGRWLAYRSNESGRDEIYVRPFPDVDSGGPWRVSTSGGSYPLWSPDGKELYYISSSAIMAVSVETEPTFKPGPPRSLFQNKYWGNFDIHPDGKRFLMLRTSETANTESTEKAAPKINIVFNWFEEVKQRVPVD